MGMTIAPRKARAFWISKPGRGEFRDVDVADPGDGEVRVRALYGGISRGTESLVFAGAVPEDQWQAMRAPFQEGAFPGPVKYGYSSVGTVEAGPDDLRGRTVFCLYPHQSEYVVPAEAVVPLPDGVPAPRAVLAANMETAVNGVWDLGAGPGDRVVVVGGGAVGCLVGRLVARLPGCAVQLVDVNPARSSVAEALGLAFAAPSEAWRDADRVVHASGSAEGLATALGLAPFEGEVLELSWYGDKPVSLPLGGAFHSRRLTLRASQVGAVSPGRRHRWSHRRRLALAVSLLDDPALDNLISGESRFEDLPALMPRLAAQGGDTEGGDTEPGDTLCHRIVYP